MFWFAVLALLAFAVPELATYVFWVAIALVMLGVQGGLNLF